ncbi:MAG: hypothetical protein ABF260_08035 [Flavobacteriaceae bacterium]
MDEGNVEIIHLADEILSNINAITYNLDSDSTIEETPISKDNILVSNINDTYKNTKQTLIMIHQLLLFLNLKLT